MPYHFSIFLILSTITYCAAMKNNNISGEILFVEKPRHIIHLNNIRTLINHERGCGIFDTTQKKEVQKITDYYITHVAVHPQKKLISLVRNENIIIYDIEQHKTIWKKNLPAIIATAHFDSLYDNIIIRYLYKYYRQDIGYNYTTNKELLLPTEENYNYNFFPLITFHPTQEKLCKIYNWNCIDIYQRNPPRIKKEFNSDAFNLLARYSPDGRLLLCGNYDDIIVLSQSGKRKKIPNHKYVKDIEFHPSSLMLVTFCQPHDVIRYWCLYPPKLIYKIALYFSPTNYLSYGGYKLLSFSPDSTKLCIALSDTCITLSVPFYVINKSIYPKQIIFMYWILRNYKIDENILLLQELIQLILKNIKIFLRNF